MDVDAVASRAVAAYRRGQGGRQARLVERKLARSRAGSRALQALHEGGGEELAREVLADELARDCRRLVLALAAGLVLAGWGVDQLLVRMRPSPPPPVVADRGTLVLNYGSSGDVDGSPIFRNGYADNVPDITIATDSIIATGGARIARLAPGTRAGLSSCTALAETDAAPRIDGLKPGDVVCVRTSAAAVASVTISNIAGEGTNQIYQLDIAYWSSP